MLVSTLVGKEASRWAILLGWSQDRPEMFLLEAQVVPFEGAQERREPYPCQEALQMAPER